MVKIKRKWGRQFSRGWNKITKRYTCAWRSPVAKKERKKTFVPKMYTYPYFAIQYIKYAPLEKYKISRKDDVLLLFKKLIVKNLACITGVFWAGELKLLVYIGIVVAPILDFMTEEHWGIDLSSLIFCNHCCIVFDTWNRKILFSFNRCCLLPVHGYAFYG